MVDGFCSRRRIKTGSIGNEGTLSQFRFHTHYGHGTLPNMRTKNWNFTHAIYNLAAYPEYLEPLREEIQSVMLEEGIWTKKRVMKMRKLDSFIRESMRLHPFVQCTSFIKVVLTQ